MFFVAGLTRWVHLFAALVWIGGLFFYALVLRPSLAEIDPGNARRLMQIASMRFRAVGLACLALLLFSGLWLVSQVLGGVAIQDAFFSTPYRRVLGLKVLLSLIAIATGTWAGLVLAPRLVLALEARDELRARSTGRAITILTIAGFVLGVAITACVAVMRVFS
ncbi:MAG: CopD family protein [Candidatus Coatesbacteria bacterium]